MSLPTWAPAPPARGLPRAAVLTAPMSSGKTAGTIRCWWTATWIPAGPPSRRPSVPSATAARSAPRWNGSTSTGAIADQFCEALEAEAARATGNGSVAPLVDTRLRDAVHAQVAEALKLGARAVEGGAVPDGPGAFYPATVLLGLHRQHGRHDRGNLRPGGSGPGGGKLRARGSARRGSGRYGLAATVLTGQHRPRPAGHRRPAGGHRQDQRGVRRRARRIRPAAGRQRRGFGYGPELLDEFTRVKVVHVAAPPATDAARTGRPSGHRENASPCGRA